MQTKMSETVRDNEMDSNSVDTNSLILRELKSLSSRMEVMEEKANDKDLSRSSSSTTAAASAPERGDDLVLPYVPSRLWTSTEFRWKWMQGSNTCSPVMNRQV